MTIASRIAAIARIDEHRPIEKYAARAYFATVFHPAISQLDAASRFSIESGFSTMPFLRDRRRVKPVDGLFSRRAEISASVIERGARRSPFEATGRFVPVEGGNDRRRRWLTSKFHGVAAGRSHSSAPATFESPSEITCHGRSRDGRQTRFRLLRRRSVLNLPYARARAPNTRRVNDGGLAYLPARPYINLSSHLETSPISLVSLSIELYSIVPISIHVYRFDRQRSHHGARETYL